MLKVSSDSFSYTTTIVDGLLIIHKVHLQTWSIRGGDPSFRRYTLTRYVKPIKRYYTMYQFVDQIPEYENRIGISYRRK